MSSNAKNLSEEAIRGGKRTADRSLRTLQQEMEHENFADETPGGRLQRVLKIYRGIKPILVVVGSLPVVPATWRAAIVMFNQALEALALSGPEIAAQFKAGKDI
jgi:hypothetical protein